MQSDHIKQIEGYSFDELKIGQQAVISRTITDTDLRNFSGVTGDTNPMHLNEEYAKTTQFGGIIVHGMLTASLISAVVGTQLPGPGVVYMSQMLRFTAPVRVNDTVYAVVTVKELAPEKKHVILTTQCFANDTMVVDGEARVKVPG